MLAQKSGALGGSEADLKNLEEQFRLLDPKGTGRIDVAAFTKARTTIVFCGTVTDTERMCFFRRT